MSSVGDIVWFTCYPVSGSLGRRARFLPPAFRKVSRQGGGWWSFYPIPTRNPLLAGVKHGNCVKAGHQHAIKCPNRRNEIGMVARAQQRRDHRVDGGVPGAHVVARALHVGGGASEVEGLFVAR